MMFKNIYKILLILFIHFFFNIIPPRQHNTLEENKQIKDEEGDGLWKDKPHKKCQKDTDARWTQKGGVDCFDYKNHIKSNAKSKLIISYKTTCQHYLISEGYIHNWTDQPCL